MKVARESDNWNKAYKANIKYALTTINLNGINGINEIVLNDGLIAISGLNGVGKSTVIAAIKDLLGCELSKSDLIKIGDIIIEGKIRIGNKQVECENVQGQRGIDKGILDEELFYIDYDQVIKTQSYLINQTNLDEYIEQYEEYSFSEDDIIELSYIIGKEYTECNVREIEDSDLEIELNSFPIFRVVLHDLEYDSSKMGVGEHYIFYLFWLLKNKVNANNVILIEEPETFISILSQRNLINYIASIIGTKKISVIMTTHSPYILEKIKNENIRILSNRGNLTNIITPSNELSVQYLLGIENKEEHGTIFVEDLVAKEFLIAILRDKMPEILNKYNIDVAKGGESAITERLLIKCSNRMKYKFIGVYDGDVRTKIHSEEFDWPFCFLPGNSCVEKEFKIFLNSNNNIKSFCKLIRKNEVNVITLLNRNAGMDYHDWFLELCKGLSIDPQYMINSYYEKWKDIKKKDLNKFLQDFKSCIDWKK